MTRRQVVEKEPSSGARGDRDISKEALRQEWQDAPPELPWTVDVAAAVWGLSEPRVRVLCEQGRVKHLKRGLKNIILVMQREQPARVAPGALTAEQRAVKKQRRAALESK